MHQKLLSYVTEKYRNNVSFITSIPHKSGQNGTLYTELTFGFSLKLSNLKLIFLSETVKFGMVFFTCYPSWAIDQVYLISLLSL